MAERASTISVAVIHPDDLLPQFRQSRADLLVGQVAVTPSLPSMTAGLVLNLQGAPVSDKRSCRS
jgi:hypothetical protein